jgi:transcriptional regulator with XRE-family HTH domain
MSAGKRLKLYILERNLSQEELASLSGVSQQTISNIIKGKNAPSGEVLAKIAKEYPDLNLNWLMTGKGKMMNNKDIEDLPRIESNEDNLLVVLNLKENMILSQKEHLSDLKETISLQKEIIRNLKQRLEYFESITSK